MVKGIRPFTITDLNISERTIETSSRINTFFRVRRGGLFGVYRNARLFKRYDGKSQLMKMRDK